MTTQISQPYDQTVRVESDDEQVVIEIPADYVVWSANPRGDQTFITIKRVVL